MARKKRAPDGNEILRTTAEEALLVSEGALAHVFETASVGMSITLPTGEISVNKAYCDLLGYTPEELKLHKWQDVTPPGDIESVQDEFSQLLTGGKSSTRFDKRYVHKNGSLIWADVSVALLRDSAGNPLYFAKTIVDITQRKQAEDALRETNEYLENLFNYANAPIIVWDPRFRITRFNRAFESLTGRSAAEVIGQSIEILFPPEEVQTSMDLIRRTLTGEHWETVEIGILHLDGSVRTVIWNSASVCAADGTSPVATIAQGQDITERKVAEERLKRTLAELSRSNKELEQFAYVASHDLQEPLRMVSSFTQLLAERYKDQLDEKARKYINYAVDGAVRMQRLIIDLLAYSRVGTRGKPLVPTDSHAILGEAIRDLAAAIEENRAIITNDDLPTVISDGTQLEQVFQNLLANAIKFHGNEQPRIHVSARDERHEWVFSVKDNGIGIEKQHAARVFEIFQRLHNRQEYPGTGIGLAVCKRIVERHGGRIWFESEPGSGTTFFFTVPKQQQET
ncbi:MAG: PAS domain S-box protein [Candidatus Brocadiia bacterium]